MIFDVIGSTVAPEKLLQECLSDLVDTYPGVVFRFLLRDEDGWNDTLDLCRDFLDRAEDASYTALPQSDWSMALANTDRVYALVGNDDPPAEVGTFLQTALDQGIEVRDLAEAGVTIVRINGNPTNNEGAEVAEEEVEFTWEELGEFADDPDSDLKIDAENMIDETARSLGIDPDEYGTWAEVAALIVEAERGAEDEPEPEEDEPEADDGKARWTAADLKGKGVRELREIAKASNIKNYRSLGPEELVEAIVGSDKGEEVDDSPSEHPGLLITDEEAFIDKVVEAVLAKLVERLSA